MKIGLDIDGVLANFYSAYEQTVIDAAGVDLFGEHRYPAEEPPTWNWPEHFGYTTAQISAAWQRIKCSFDFWLKLDPLEGITVARRLSHTDHDVYYITARPGYFAKRQTEAWLQMHGIPSATVLLSDDKAAAARALALDFYVDDKLENIQAIDGTDLPTQAYLLNRRYNQHGVVLNRVDSLLSAAHRAQLL